jgi:carboxyl-terminal processing protease
MRSLSPLSRRRPLGIFATLLVTGLLGVGLITQLSAELTPPGGRERQVALKVVDFLKRQHLSRRPIDETTAQKALPIFLNSYDPMKLYFTQQDFEEFKRSEKELDETLRQGKIQFGYTVFQRFLKRIDERLVLIHELLDEDFDFTVEESMTTDAESTTYASSDAEIRDRWRKRIKYDLLNQKADKVEGDEARKKLRQRYDNFAKRMRQIDNDELLESYLNAFTTSFDPHTTYMSPSQLENFRILMRLNLEGIGAQLQAHESGYTVVTKVIPDGAADKHGKLKPEDRIVSVGQGKDGEMVDVVNMKLNDVVKLIRGKAGSVVRLGVKPEGEAETQIYEIVRSTVELKDSEARGVIFDEGRKPGGGSYKIGVIDLPSFYLDMEGARLNVDGYKSTTRDVQRILESFNRNGVDAVVLDLRRNGGGSLTEAISLTGLFVDQGPVVQVKDSQGAVDHYDDTVPGMSWEGPLVVLTSKFSASASEILAGAIQDYRRGIVVGDYATHGKGTVQTLRELGERLFPIPNPPNQGAIKVTVQQFYRPNGESTQQRGVLSDIELPSLTTHMPIGEADLQNALPFGRVEPVPFTPANMVATDLIDSLRERSAARVATSPDFAKRLEDIERYKKQKAAKSVSLHEETFFAQRANLDASKEEEKQFDNQEKSEKDVIKRDFYLDEVFEITLDYLGKLSDPNVAARR